MTLLYIINPVRIDYSKPKYGFIPFLVSFNLLIRQKAKAKCNAFALPFVVTFTVMSNNGKSLTFLRDLFSTLRRLYD